MYGDNRLIIDPDQVAYKENVAWATAFWYWRTRVGINNLVKQGFFGSSTKAINGALECNGSNSNKSLARFNIYKNVLIAFEINETPNERGCYN